MSPHLNRNRVHPWKNAVVLTSELLASIAIFLACFAAVWLRDALSEGMHPDPFVLPALCGAAAAAQLYFRVAFNRESVERLREELLLLQDQVAAQSDVESVFCRLEQLENESPTRRVTDEMNVPSTADSRGWK